MDNYINAIRYERKLLNRHLKEMNERLEDTAKNYPHVDLFPFVNLITLYQSRMDAFGKAIRLYRKHVLVPAKKSAEVEVGEQV